MLALLLAALAWVGLAFAGAPAALAHPQPDSVVTLELGAAGWTGAAHVPALELKAALGAEPDVRAYFARHVRVPGWTTRIDDVRASGSDVDVRFTLTPPAGADPRTFTFAYDAVVERVVTHQVLVFLKSDWRNGQLAEDHARPLGTIATDVATNTLAPLPIALDEGSALRGTWAMVLLGMRHIREGLDHVFFLLTLLLVAPLATQGGRWTGWQGLGYTLKRFGLISLAFTAGHSATLLLGSLGLVGVPAGAVEVAIAGSVLLSALNVAFPLFHRREAAIAAAFGLIHGLAFSQTLSGLDLDLGSRLLSVLGFNVGIEAMQLIIMAAAFPLLLLSKWAGYRDLRLASAILVVLLSLTWIAERLGVGPT